MISLSSAELNLSYFYSPIGFISLSLIFQVFYCPFCNLPELSIIRHTFGRLLRATLVSNLKTYTPTAPLRGPRFG